MISVVKWWQRLPKPGPNTATKKKADITVEVNSSKVDGGRWTIPGVRVAHNRDVDFEPSIFGRFISQCSLLERLRLVGCTDWDSLEVEGPSLRFFSFHGVFKSIRFKNSPVLAEVSLSTPVFENWEIQSSNCIKHFAFLPTPEKLHLHPGVLEFLGAGGVPNRLPDSLSCLRVLDLSIYLDRIKEVACALCLIRSSPNLKMPRITLYAIRNGEAVIEFLRAQETPDRHLNQLRRVEIAVFSGVEPQMEFARYLLASAAGLEEMVIAPVFSSLSGDGGLSLMNQLKQLPRASPSALIVVRKR
ncbi:hypothetical protein Pfo_006710 [Paulownia fortunei]|nr:hypothetical protein Pfo_006710 [Paulownia fortunei]